MRIQMLVGLAAVVTSLAMPHQASAIPYDVIANSPGGWPIEGAPTTKVIRNQEEFEALWRASGRNVAPPVVDFRRHTVIGYFLFLRTGSRLLVESVEVRAGTLTVELIESTPGNCCVVGQGAGAPNVLIATMPWHGPVDVQVRREARPPCSGCSP